MQNCKVTLLTHWGQVTHICVGNVTIIGPDNGLSPGRRQAIIWTNARILLIGPWGTNLNEILIGIHTFSFKKIHLNMSSAKWRPFCLGLNVLMIPLRRSSYCPYQWLSAKLQYLHCEQTGYIPVFRWATAMCIWVGVQKLFHEYWRDVFFRLMTHVYRHLILSHTRCLLMYP